MLNSGDASEKRKSDEKEEEARPVPWIRCHRRQRQWSRVKVRQ